MKTIIACLVFVVLAFGGGGVMAACDDEVREQSRETLKRYVATITAKDQDRNLFGKNIAETLITIANCDSVKLPVMLNDRRGFYQGIFIIMQYAGVEQAASRPSLQSADEAYNRLNKERRK